jgi:regulatory factor X
VAFLQEFIRKSNQQAQLAMSMRAASSSQSGSDARSEEDEEDDESDAPPPSRGASLHLGVETRSGASSSLDDKTPTTNTLLSAAQGSRKPTDGFTPAQIRNRKGTTADDTAKSPSTSIGKDAAPYVASHPHVSVRQLPNFPNIEEALGANASAASPQNIAAREVWRWFEAHLDGLMDSVRTFRFDQFEIHLRTFWAGLSGDHREVVHAPAVAGLMAKADAMVYDVSQSFVQLNFCLTPHTGNFGDTPLAGLGSHSAPGAH